jgi:gp45 sliding clamp, C terminal
MKLKPQTMKLSDKTLTLLKNFSSINQSILFKEGSSLRTISVMKNILAEASIDEELPKDFGIYDLNQFLNGLNLHQNAELDFVNDGYVVIREGKSRSKYFFADPNVIVTPPDKSINLPSEDVCFMLDTKELDKLLKAAAVYQLPDLSAVGEAGVIKLVVRDKKNDTSNDFSIVVGETDSEFVFNFKVENIKILPGSYEVVVSQKLLSRFKSNDYDLCYYIALEPDSTFG